MMLKRKNKMTTPFISIISPTTGKDSLFKLIDSLEKQGISYVHILLWDDKREDRFLYPDASTLKTLNPMDLNKECEDGSRRYSIVIPGGFINGKACGSSLRAIGLMAASTNLVTFADDDVWMEDNHLKNLLKLVEGKEWAYCRRKIWSPNKELIGIDNFESVGDSPDRKVDYEMVDNNCMIFSRRFGTSGSVLYRETNAYNDDRLFYAFLKKYAGQPCKTNLSTVNQVCPKRLEPMFRQMCTKI